MFSFFSTENVQHKNYVDSKYIRGVFFFSCNGAHKDTTITYTGE